MRRGRAISGVRARAPAPTTPKAAWLPPLSFKDAAVELCVTPSAVSRQIKSLEDQLGVALFARGRNGLALTRAGTRYLADVQAAFVVIGQGTTRVTESRGGKLVRLASVQALAANWIIPNLHELVDTHPEIELQLVTGESLADLPSGEADLAIRFGQGTWPGVMSEPLLALDLFPVAAPALARTIATPQDLFAHRWLHLSLYPRAFRDWLAAAGQPDLVASKNLSFDGADLVFRAAAAGLGVAMASTVLVRPYLAANTLVRLFSVDAAIAGQYYLVGRADDVREPSIAAVRAFVHRIARATRV
jgi:LysR family transcriptional regulator, glycine cleavage system transcriptional activator